MAEGIGRQHQEPCGQNEGKVAPAPVFMTLATASITMVETAAPMTRISHIAGSMAKGRHCGADQRTW